MGAVQDIITHANFGEDWLKLKGFGLARGRILAFSIDLLRCLYNTLAIPYECVISFEVFSILEYVAIKPRILGPVAMQPALSWQAVCIPIVVGGIKCYHPSVKWIPVTQY